MSISFYVDIGSPPMKRVYLSEKDALPASSFEADFGVEVDDNGRHYAMEPDFISEDYCNANARLILEAVNLKPDDCGAVDFEDLPEIRRRAIEVMNTDKVNRHTRKPSMDSTPGGAFLIGLGLSSDQLIDKLQRFLRLIDEAQKRQTGIYWG